MPSKLAKFTLKDVLLSIFYLINRSHSRLLYFRLSGNTCQTFQLTAYNFGSLNPETYFLTAYVSIIIFS